MQKYSLDPDGVDRTATTVGTKSDEFQAAHKDLQTAADDSFTAAGGGQFSATLSAFFSERAGAVPHMAERTSSASNGAKDANKAYGDGDNQAAGNVNAAQNRGGHPSMSLK